MAKIKNERPLTLSRLRGLLDYDAETGIFRWRLTQSPRAVDGSIAGCIRKRGYRIILIDGEQYKASRLAWFYTHGIWPPECLDHVNRIKDDDRISNLRLATIAENAFNRPTRSKTGIKGVYKKQDRKNFFASIVRDGKRYYLGTYEHLENAAAARRQAALRLQGKFAYEARSEE